MKPFIEQAQMYASYHRQLMTRYTHFAGIPTVVLSFMILLGFVHIIIPGVLYTNFAVLGTLALLVYYFRLNWLLALASTPILLILLWIASFFNYAGPTKLGIWAFIITFVVGWGLQLYGHFIEGKRPAFMDNITQAFIAPLYMVAELFFMAGMMGDLKKQIYGQEDESKE